MKLDFLKNVTVSVAPTKPVAARTGIKKQRQPESGLTIRLFKDGSVYPSQELVDKYTLEYTPRDENSKPTGNALDVVDSRDMAKQVETEVPFVGIVVTPRASGRTDIFSACKYAEDGSPTTTVGEQGAATYGKAELIPLLEAVYGEEFAFNEQGFVDLTVVEDMPITAPDGRFFVFKTISRGVDAGKKDYAIRDNATILPLIPAEVEVSTDDLVAVGDVSAALALDEVNHIRKSETKGKKAVASIDPGDEDDDPELAE